MEFKANFVVFDLETGGLKEKENPVLEIAMFVINNDLTNGSDYTSLIKPYGDYIITQGALMANGLDVNMLKVNGKDVQQVVDETIDFLSKQKVGREKPILCGHNIDHFDIPFLNEMFTFCGKDLSKYVNDNFTIDTMWWSRIKWPESNNYKLGTCVQNCGIELVNAHRAVADTIANRELVRKFLQSLRNDNVGENQSERFREKFKF